jgi:hypothetical protein
MVSLAVTIAAALFLLAVGWVVISMGVFVTHNLCASPIPMTAELQAAVEVLREHNRKYAESIGWKPPCN